MKDLFLKYCTPITWITLIFAGIVFWAYIVKWVVLWVRQ